MARTRSIKFFCTECGQRIEAQANRAGEFATCPTCEGMVEVPVPDVTFFCVHCGLSQTTRGNDAGMNIPCEACGKFTKVPGGLAEVNSMAAPTQTRTGRHKSRSPLSGRDEVGFSKAKFRVSCPECGQVIRAKGRRFAKRRKPFNCPTCATKFREEFTGAQLAEGQVLVYRRLGDWYSCDGRIGRAEYWIGLGLSLPVLVLLVLLGSSTSASSAEQNLAVIVFSGVLLCPLWAKRLHDIGISGQWMWLWVIGSSMAATYQEQGELDLSERDLLLFARVLYGVGVVLKLLMAFCPGKKTGNRFGPRPSKYAKKWF